MLPLEGVTVVALEQAVAAPFASRQLADQGARVIKVERVDGGDFARAYDSAGRGGLGTHFAWLNRSKESVALDLKRDEGRAILTDLVAGADVFLQNLAPGAAARLGFGADVLRARDPASSWSTCPDTGRAARTGTSAPTTCSSRRRPG
jgi:crotonobetainyl-CoA:carnitine CoA-transferase CaiB-like acyl-CoA transferase